MRMKADSHSNKFDIIVKYFVERGNYNVFEIMSFNVQTNYENIKDWQRNYKREFAGYACSYRLKLAFDLDSK